jgi:hypothetical protein
MGDLFLEFMFVKSLRKKISVRDKMAKTCLVSCDVRCTISAVVFLLMGHNHLRNFNRLCIPWAMANELSCNVGTDIQTWMTSTLN